MTRVGLRSASVLIVVAGIAAQTGGIAGAHPMPQQHGYLRTAIARAPDIPGLELKVLDGGRPALYVHNATGRVLEVFGQAGEPLLRIGPGGVEANTGSPSFRLAAGRTIQGPGAASRGALGGHPRWKMLSRQAIWGWLQPVTGLPTTGTRGHELSTGRAARRWRVTLKLGSRPLQVWGRTEWVASPRVVALKSARSAAPTAAVPSNRRSDRFSLPRVTSHSVV